MSACPQTGLWTTYSLWNPSEFTRLRPAEAIGKGKAARQPSFFRTLLKSVGISLTFPTGAGDKDKSLRKKVEETVDQMVATNVPKKEFIGVIKGLSDVNHPFSPDILHAYIHNGFYTPMERDLTAAWDNGQPLFERIWS